ERSPHSLPQCAWTLTNRPIRIIICLLLTNPNTARSERAPSRSPTRPRKNPMLGKNAQPKLEKEMARMKLSPTEWITVQEAARRLKASPGAVNYMMISNGLLSQKVAGRRLVNAERLEHLRKCRDGEFERVRVPTLETPPADTDLIRHK